MKHKIQKTGGKKPEIIDTREIQVNWKIAQKLEITKIWKAEKLRKIWTPAKCRFSGSLHRHNWKNWKMPTEKPVNFDFAGNSVFTNVGFRKILISTEIRFDFLILADLQYHLYM